MSLFKKLFGKKEIENPTKFWPLESPEDLVFDLENKIFCEISFGTDIKGCHALGKTDHFRGKEGYYCLTYLENGFVVEFNEGEFDFFKVFMLEDKYNPQGISLTTLKLNDGVIINKETDEAALKELFGESIYRDVDDREIVLRYKYNEMTVEVEATLQGHVKNIFFSRY